MERTLRIEAGSHRPEVEFNAAEGKLWITGRSIVENSIRFYEPLAFWIEEYCNHPAIKTELHLRLEYFNTSTSKYLLSFIERVEMLYKEGHDAEIFWYSTDEEMLELGEDYAAMVDVPFTFLKYSL